ncbi:LacI family DNA-binding transcriptional regulator [Rathayibacter sp. KR2-224]|uniref:LacI family DNA-binding transcriptional regulator n=1 Tax=Rathayibacter sp. KR2-224 TaxID=3400913 RepID=UPI003C044458
MVSVRDVAIAAGVSVGTVSNVLNRPDRVAAATVERVNAAIAELGFVRNDAARQLRAGRSRSIGLIVLDVGNPFFTDVARGAEQRAAEDGFSVLLGNSDESSLRESGYLDLFEEQRVHGVLISPVTDDLPRLRKTRDRGIPVVLVDREAADRSFSSVAVDDVAGGRTAMEHLIETGRRRIAFVGGPSSIRQVADRLSGARIAASERAGVALEYVPTSSLTVRAGAEAAAELMSRDPASRPDAILAANDLVSIGALQAAIAAGRRPPEDLAIIGYDDIDFAAAATVPLSSMRQPAALIGHTALELLLGEAEQGEGFEPKQIVYQPELVVRQSTAG